MLHKHSNKAKYIEFNPCQWDSIGTKLFCCATSGVASFFSPGGKRGKRHFFFWGGGQDPQKVISFYHFVQVNAHFDFTQSGGGQQAGGKIFYRGICPYAPE